MVRVLLVEEVWRTLMSGQQTSPAAHLAPASPSAVHRWPGLTGVRQCLASLFAHQLSLSLSLRVFLARGGVWAYGQQ